VVPMVEAFTKLSKWAGSRTADVQRGPGRREPPRVFCCAAAHKNPACFSN